MRLKVVPEPPDGGDDSGALAFVATVRDALPLVPGSETDCCARLVARTDIESRDVAREWLTFLRALDLAERTDSGFRRLRTDVERDALAGAFLANVHGAREVRDSLADADGPLTADEAAERVPMPDWERQRHPDPEAVWRERIARLLGWAAALGVAERTGENSGYVVVDADA